MCIAVPVLKCCFHSQRYLTWYKHRSLQCGVLRDVGKPKVFPKLIEDLYLLRKESNEKAAQNRLFMLVLQAELEHNNRMGG